MGWVGLGAMGTPMARVAARAGYAVRGFDIDPERAKALATDGVAPAATVAEAATGADVLVIMVATPAQGESVILGGGGAAGVLAAGSVVLVMSTVGVAAVTRWAAVLADNCVELVDAPVSGGVARAASGDLLAMVGGAPGAVQAVSPLLDALASKVSMVGDRAGDGQKLKLVNQLLCGVHIAVAAEALAFAGSIGLDREKSWEVLRQGAAASFMLDDRGRRMVNGSFVEVKSALDIFVKDMGLVVDAADQSGASAMLAKVAQGAFQQGSAAGYGRLDDSSVLLVYEHLLEQGSRAGPRPE